MFSLRTLANIRTVESGTLLFKALIYTRSKHATPSRVCSEVFKLPHRSVHFPRSQSGMSKFLTLVVLANLTCDHCWKCRRRCCEVVPFLLLTIARGSGTHQKPLLPADQQVMILMQRRRPVHLSQPLRCSRRKLTHSPTLASNRTNTPKPTPQHQLQGWFVYCFSR